MTRADVILVEVGGIAGLAFTAISVAGTGNVEATLLADASFALGCLIAACRPRRSRSPVDAQTAKSMPQVWHATVDMPKGGGANHDQPRGSGRA